MTETFDVIIDIDPRSESIWKLFRGHIGIGKTLYMTGEVFTIVREEKIKLVITNYDLYGLPEDVEVFKSGSVRKIMMRMLENYDMVAKKPKVPVLIVVDEINNTLSSKQAASNISTWITTIASNARKYGVRAFYFATQGRKASDYRLRVNCSYEIAPTGTSNIDGKPQAYWWNNIELAETDYHRGESKYESAVLLSSEFTVDYLKSRYNTTELVPIDLNPSVKEDEIIEVMESFLQWCTKKGIVLEEYKRTDVKDFIKRWNNDKGQNVIPYSPGGCDVIFSECVLRGYVEPKEEKPEVAEEPSEPEVERTTLPERVAAVAISNEKPNTDSGDGVPTIPVKEVSEVKESSLPALPGLSSEKNEKRSWYLKNRDKILAEKKRKYHERKSVETGVETVVQDEGPRPPD